MDTQCVKISALRLSYPNENIDLEKWMTKSECLYVGRKGRIFIKQLDGTRKVFVYHGSKWGNPFKPGINMLHACLEAYETYIVSSGLIDKIRELDGKVLGCFCDQSAPCHAKSLIKLLNRSKKNVINI